MDMDDLPIQIVAYWLLLLLLSTILAFWIERLVSKRIRMHWTLKFAMRALVALGFFTAFIILIAAATIRN
jgi:hypothetical protein